MPKRERLTPYLSRYVIYFFDLNFAHTDPAREYIRQFMNNHRQFRWPEQKNSVSIEEISEVFEQTVDSLRKMDKKELTQLWRQKAKELHPPLTPPIKGGESKGCHVVRP